MSTRRLIVVLVALLIAVSLVAALVDESTTGPPAPPAPIPGGGGSASATGIVRARIADGSPARPVRARVGDELVLVVSPRLADQVELRGLGEIEPVDPFTPARFDVPLEAPGTYPVRLLAARKTIGRIVVTRRSTKRPEKRGH